MTDTQRREIKSHLMRGLESLCRMEGTTTLVLENCPDETDYAAQLAMQGVNVAVAHRRLLRMNEFEGALKRLREHDYGICEECGEDIGFARLKANPSARLCVACQSTLEEGLSH